MSLQTRLSELITAIGADIKSLQDSVASLGGGGGTPARYNASIANQVIGAADTYLIGSSIAIPQGKIQAKTIYRVKFNVTKTAAGVAAPTYTIRVGTAGSTADTLRSSTSGSLQTAAIDEGWFEIDCVFRASGAAAIIQTVYKIWHRLTTTGLTTTAGNVILIDTGAAFDVTGAGLIIGMSVNPGTGSSWTVREVTAELLNLA